MRRAAATSRSRLPTSRTASRRPARVGRSLPIPVPPHHPLHPSWGTEMPERVLGIDIGTPGVRAPVFEPTGEIIADASLPCGPDSPHPGWAEGRAESWWRTTQRLCEDLKSRGVALADLAAIAVTGQAPTA